tara:strand:- start:1435 stop:2601 length:1167 start_codon:yes stop_codon:yes gene_type:complete
MINYGKQFLDRKDILSVAKVLSSNWLTQGPYVEKFEKALKKKFGSKYCSVVANGTAALHLAGIALGWKHKDIVIGSSLSFVASSNAIVYSGATPDFVDIDKNTYTIDVEKLEKKIKFYLNKGKKVSAVVATDYAGHPCNWEALKAISKKYNVKLVNDNCHAIGANFKSDEKYAVKFADIVTHSYHPVKNITTGEGGAILTNNKIIATKIRMLRTHGITKNPNLMSKNEGPWYYEMKELGYNYRITDFQCALGLSQLKKLNKFTKKRKEIAKIYNSSFYENNFLKIPNITTGYGHAYHLYPLQINFRNIDQKKKLFKEFKKKKINLQVHYIPIHLQPYYKKKYGFKRGDYPITEKFYNKEVSLPIYYSLKKKEIYKVTRFINDFCNKNL